MAGEGGPANSSGPLDRIFLSLGVWGRWQILQIGLVLSLQSVAVYQLLSIVFLGYEPPFRCRDSHNTTSLHNSIIFNSSCSRTSPSNNNTNGGGSCRMGYQYNIPEKASIVSEWDLVCDKEYLTGLSQTILIGGQAVGAVLFSYLSDRHGRRKVFLAVQWGMLVISLATVFAPDIPVFIVCRFFTGAFQQGLIMLGTVLPLEITTMEHRPMILLLTGVIWGSFNGSTALLGYLFRHLSWRYLQAALSGASLILLIPNMIYLDESLRWLVANGRRREADIILKKAAKMNRIRLRADEDLTVGYDIQINVSPSDQHDGNSTDTSHIDTDASKIDSKPLAVYSFSDILKNKRLRRFSLVMFFIWIVTSFGYFGLSLEASKLAGNRFVNFFLLAIADVPAAIFSFITMKWVGRRATVVIFNGLTFVCMLVSIFLVKFTQGLAADKINTWMAIIGKFGISACFSSLFIYTSELFPTTIRGLGCGLSSAASRVGGMIAPFFAMLITTYPLLFPISLASGCCIVCLLTFLLPETRDKELPQRMEDIEEWFNKTSTDPKRRGSRGTDESLQVKLLSDYD